MIKYTLTLHCVEFFSLHDVPELQGWGGQFRCLNNCERAKQAQHFAAGGFGAAVSPPRKFWKFKVLREPLVLSHNGLTLHIIVNLRQHKF